MSQDLAPAPIPAPTSDETTPLTGVCVVIPARGGSKGVTRKNLRRVGGVPLVVRAIRSVSAVPLVDEVYVSTDDTEIAKVGTAGWGQGDPSPRAHLGRPGVLGIRDPARTRRDRRGVGAPRCHGARAGDEPVHRAR